jgi:hypothetical protein
MDSQLQKSILYVTLNVNMSLQQFDTEDCQLLISLNVWLFLHSEVKVNLSLWHVYRDALLLVSNQMTAEYRRKVIKETISYQLHAEADFNPQGRSRVLVLTPVPSSLTTPQSKL